MSKVTRLKPLEGGKGRALSLPRPLERVRDRITERAGGLLADMLDGADDTLRQIAMHVAAAMPRPLGLSAEDIPSDLVEKEKKFRIEQAMESGKPQEIAEKIVEGGMRKFFEEVALLEQDFIMDTSKKIKDLVGSGGSLSAFRRWQVGEEG